MKYVKTYQARPFQPAPYYIGLGYRLATPGPLLAKVTRLMFGATLDTQHQHGP